jgi:hypothetical protein
MCRELRGKEALQAELRRAHRHASEKYTTTEEEDDFRELLDPPRIVGELYLHISYTAHLEIPLLGIQEFFLDLLYRKITHCPI